jgi:hypothetical protein
MNRSLQRSLVLAAEPIDRITRAPDSPAPPILRDFLEEI